ncbi:efflux RND transporter periplasmic adaptor subunit [Aeoliella sp.]|uniref:efflux RND transporter periplasmic adaptor subunit n=1 Tax=Aeoliella sp. TaxID=2795800 RepID=UPI003CCBA627
MSQTVIETPQSTTPSAVPDRQRTTRSEPRLRGTATWVRDRIPTLLVLATFGGLFYYGHHSDWKLPKFSALTGTATSAPGDWCEEHGIPESQCVACNPGLLPAEPDYGWCAEHGVHNCTLHHPDVAEVKETPVVSSADFEQAAVALSLRERPTNNAACKVYQRFIQFASVDAVQQAGVEVTLVDQAPVTEWVTGNGEIRYDATRFARLSTRVPGTAWRVFKSIGDTVQEGEVLAVVDAMEVGRLKGNLVKAIVEKDLAQKNVDRLTGLTEGVVPGKKILENEAVLAKAEAEVLSAEQALANLGLAVDAESYAGLPKQEVVERLRFLGFSEVLAEQMKSQTATANLIPIRSPMAGVIVDRQVVAGEVVDPSKVLFDVADPSKMWLMLNIPLEEAWLLQIGQPVRFLPNGSREEVAGQLSWISTAADKQTRMVKVRAELDNSHGQLRDETFGEGRIMLREEQAAVIVPKSAVHWEGCCQVVFVRDRNYFSDPDSPKLFHLRSVRTGAVNGDDVEVIVGLLPGEVVVTEGGDVLRAQLLKNSLGAGCCAE